MKKDNRSMVLAVVALVLAIIALVNSFSTGSITGHTLSRTDIAYGSGYVGIGTDTDGPQKPLHVVGDALFEDDLNVETDLLVGDDLSVGGVGIFDNITTTYLYVNGTAISNVASGGVDHGGDIDIGGNLDVVGDITADAIMVDDIQLIIYDGGLPTCDSSNEGLLQLDNSSGSLELKVCHADAWLGVVLAAPIP